MLHRTGMVCHNLQNPVRCSEAKKPVGCDVIRPEPIVVYANAYDVTPTEEMTARTSRRRLLPRSPSNLQEYAGEARRPTRECEHADSLMRRRHCDVYGTRSSSQLSSLPNLASLDTAPPQVGKSIPFPDHHHPDPATANRGPTVTFELSDDVIQYSQESSVTAGVMRRSRPSGYSSDGAVRRRRQRDGRQQRSRRAPDPATLMRPKAKHFDVCDLTEDQLVHRFSLLQSEWERCSTCSSSSTDDSEGFNYYLDDDLTPVSPRHSTAGGDSSTYPTGFVRPVSSPLHGMGTQSPTQTSKRRHRAKHSNKHCIVS